MGLPCRCKSSIDIQRKMQLSCVVNGAYQAMSLGGTDVINQMVELLVIVSRPLLHLGGRFALSLMILGRAKHPNMRILHAFGANSPLTSSSLGTRVRSWSVSQLFGTRDVEVEVYNLLCVVNHIKCDGVE